MTFNYDTAAWRRIRKLVLERDGHCCQIRGPKCRLDANEVDHIIPWRLGGPLTDEGNLRASCGPCNSRRARREGVGATMRPPASREW